MADTEQEAYTLEEGLSRGGEPSDDPHIEVQVPDRDQKPPPERPAQGELRAERLHLSDNAMRVLKRRYLMRDTEGNVIETAEEMFRRVAKNIAQADLKYDADADVLALEQEFYDLMTVLEFLPNSPTLMNAGRELQQLSACFVLPIGDSMDSIFEAVKNTALIHKTGGGTGFSFSSIRPRDDVVLSTKGVSSGPISFMTVFNAATETIKQGGTRRGANMAILRVDHPNILDFISCKEDNDKLTNFNISVGITEKFMQAVEYDQEYELINPRTKKVQRKVRAKDVFNKIVEHAWLNGEPGIIFLDRLNKDNPTPHIGDIESTNPCGEQPLLPYESCNLGSINLSLMVRQVRESPELDWERLARVVRSSVHFLDNVIDMNAYPLPEIERMTKGNRKIGLGVMGFADMLAQLRIPYDSERGVDIAEKVMHFIQDQGRKASVDLAKDRGVFPNFKGSKYDVYDGPRLRNATVTTIAPTGSISIIGDASPGVEPYFALAFTRNVLDNEKLVSVNAFFEEMAKEEGFFSEELMDTIARHGSVKDNEDVPTWVQRIFVTAHDTTPEWHVKMQAAFQKFTDNAVSKTVNFSNKATTADVERVYMLAYHSGCKGVTIYRDGSRDAQVISTGKTAKANAQAHAGAQLASQMELSVHQRSPRKRPVVTMGSTERMRTGCGYLYVTINEDEDGLCELFTQMGKGGGCAASNSEAVARLCSLSFRSGVDPNSIIKQLKGIRCPSPAMDTGGVIRSCTDAVAKSLERYIERREERLRREAEAKAIEAEVDRGMAELVDKLSHQATVTTTIETPRDTDGNCPECPDCGSMIEYSEGCIVCRGCGYSKCG
jgi:ribonucleoside-diphosphate reductase alpha chain